MASLIRSDGFYYHIIDCPKGRYAPKCEFLLFGPRGVIPVIFCDVDADEDEPLDISDGRSSPVTSIMPLRLNSDPKVLDEALHIGICSEGGFDSTPYKVHWNTDGSLVWDQRSPPSISRFTACPQADGSLLVKRQEYKPAPVMIHHQTCEWRPKLNAPLRTGFNSFESQVYHFVPSSHIFLRDYLY